MAAPNPTCPSYKKWRGVSKRENQRVQEDTKPPVFAPKFNVYVPPELQDLLKTRPRTFSPDDLGEAVTAIKASDSVQWLPATKAIRKALSADKKPPIQEVVDLGALPRLVHFMTLDDTPDLQFEAAWAVCNVASGNSAQCTAAVEAGALPPAIKLLNSPKSDMREQAAWLLGNVLGDGAALRDKCLAVGLLPVLLEVVAGEKELKPLRQLTWMLLNVTRFKPRKAETLLQVLPHVARIAESTEDEETLADALSAVAHIVDDCTDEVARDARAVVQRAGRLINAPDTTSRTVQMSAAKVLSAMCTGGEAATQLVVDTGVLSEGYKRLLDQGGAEQGALMVQVCFAISNIAAGTQDQAIAVKDAGVLPGLAGLFKRYSGHDAVRREATWALSNVATKGLADLAHAVREAGASAPLAEFLASHAPKTAKADVRATVAAAEALLAIAQAGALPPEDGSEGGNGDGSGSGGGGGGGDNPVVAEFAAHGVYAQLTDTLDRGLLKGQALNLVQRLLDEFPPPPAAAS